MGIFCNTVDDFKCQSNENDCSNEPAGAKLENNLADMGTRSEIGLGDKHAEESELVTELEMVKRAVQKQSNGSCYANEEVVRLEERINMQVAEEECSALQDQFSKLSCEDPTSKLGDSQPNMVSDIESLGMFDEIQLSQLQKACEENVR